MDNTAWRLTVRELTEVGFGAAATASLRARMDKGDEQIEVPFRKWLEGDEVQGRLQLRRSDPLGHYALNAFEMRLRKARHTEWMQQTFQQSGGVYTLQQAYNLMSGRPVYKQLEGAGGNPYEVWLKLDFDRKLENGNYARKYYHADDGFNLGEVLGRYPIRELGDARQRKALIGALERGDLAAVTMKGAEGPERKLFITPSIPTRSLLVQDENGIRVSPEKLVKPIGERQPAPRRVKRQRLS